MRKRILTLILTVLALFSLTACGIQLPPLPRPSDAGATSAAPTDLRKKWQTMYLEGAEGQSADGEKVFFAFHSRSDLREGAMMIVSADGTQLLLYETGEIVMEDGHLVIVDVGQGRKLPFDVTVKEVQNGFEILFLDGAKADMYFVDQDTILDHMVSIAEELGQND